MQPWAGHEVLLSELGSREEPPGEGAVLWVAVTVIHTQVIPTGGRGAGHTPQFSVSVWGAKLCSACESPPEKHCRRQDNTWLF